MMVITRPQVGQQAPDFEGESTLGRVSLSRYRGGWLVLFSYIKDDTSVCTAQCTSFVDHQEAFKAMGVQLLGLSVDSLQSHYDWLAKLERELDIEVGFPLIADPDKKIVRLYGILDEEKGLAVRGVFLIDPEGKTRFMSFYPSRVAPSVEETLRVVKELKELKAK